MACAMTATLPVAAEEPLAKAETLKGKDQDASSTPASTHAGSPFASEGCWDSEDGFALPEAEDSGSEDSDDEGVLRLRMSVRKFALAGARRALPRPADAAAEAEQAQLEVSDESEGDVMGFRLAVRQYAQRCSETY